MPHSSKWYRIDSRAGVDTASVHIYDDIGQDGTTAKAFIQELQQITASRIELHLSTKGGDVFDGVAIHNALRQHKANVTVYVDSLAASIGSVIAMAGNKIVMRPYSQMMIHEASAWAEGANSAEMSQLAALLDKTSQNIAQVYADRAGGTVEHWRGLMRAETWFSAEEAVGAGLADEVIGQPAAVARRRTAGGGQRRPSPAREASGDPSEGFQGALLAAGLRHSLHQAITKERNDR